MRADQAAGITPARPNPPHINPVQNMNVSSRWQQNGNALSSSAVRFVTPQAKNNSAANKIAARAQLIGIIKTVRPSLTT